MHDHHKNMTDYFDFDEVTFVHVNFAVRTDIKVIVGCYHARHINPFQVVILIIAICKPFKHFFHSKKGIY